MKNNWLIIALAVIAILQLSTFVNGDDSSGNTSVQSNEEQNENEVENNSEEVSNQQPEENHDNEEQDENENNSLEQDQEETDENEDENHSEEEGENKPVPPHKPPHGPHHKPPHHHQPSLHDIFSNWRPSFLPWRHFLNIRRGLGPLPFELRPHVGPLALNDREDQHDRKPHNNGAKPQHGKSPQPPNVNATQSDHPKPPNVNATQSDSPKLNQIELTPQNDTQVNRKKRETDRIQLNKPKAESHNVSGRHLHRHRPNHPKPEHHGHGPHNHGHGPNHHGHGPNHHGQKPPVEEPENEDEGVENPENEDEEVEVPENEDEEVEDPENEDEGVEDAENEDEGVEGAENENVSVEEPESVDQTDENSNDELQENRNKREVETEPSNDDQNPHNGPERHPNGHRRHERKPNHPKQEVGKGQQDDQPNRTSRRPHGRKHHGKRPNHHGQKPDESGQEHQNQTQSAEPHQNDSARQKRQSSNEKMRKLNPVLSRQALRSRFQNHHLIKPHGNSAKAIKLGKLKVQKQNDKKDKQTSQSKGLNSQKNLQRQKRESASALENRLRQIYRSADTKSTAAKRLAKTSVSNVGRSLDNQQKTLIASIKRNAASAKKSLEGIASRLTPSEIKDCYSETTWKFDSSLKEAETKSEKCVNDQYKSAQNILNNTLTSIDKQAAQSSFRVQRLISACSRYAVDYPNDGGDIAREACLNNAILNTDNNNDEQIALDKLVSDAQQSIKTSSSVIAKCVSSIYEVTVNQAVEAAKGIEACIDKAFNASENQATTATPSG